MIILVTFGLYLVAVLTPRVILATILWFIAAFFFPALTLALFLYKRI